MRLLKFLIELLQGLGLRERCYLRVSYLQTAPKVTPLTKVLPFCETNPSQGTDDSKDFLEVWGSRKNLPEIKLQGNLVSTIKNVQYSAFVLRFQKYSMPQSQSLNLNEIPIFLSEIPIFLFEALFRNKPLQHLQTFRQANQFLSILLRYRNGHISAAVVIPDHN